MNLNQSLQELLELEREQGLKDLLYFDREILGYDPVERTHRECLDYVSSDRKRKLVLMPRHSYKTTLITVGKVIQKICQNPNIRILIDSETHGQSVDMLRMIKEHLTGNAKLIGMFGEFKKGDSKNKQIWKGDSIVISQRTGVFREPTVRAGSVGKVNVGDHYDLIISDDWVSDKNTTTSDQIKKVIDHWKAIHSVLTPTGELLIIGTRWSYDDLYGHIIDNEELYKEYLPFIRSAYKENGDLFFPEELTQAFLETQRKTQGEYMFSCLYLNDPLPVSSQDFQEEWIKSYKLVRVLKEKDLEFYFAVDPAISQNKSACDSVIIVVGIDSENNMYVVDYTRKKLKPNEIIEETYLWAEEYEPEQVGVEMNAFQKSLKFGFDDEALERNWWLPIVEITSDGDKDRRIRSVQPRFSAGKVFVRDSMKDLRRDLMRFPHISDNKKDLLDALGIVNQMVRRREVEEQEYMENPNSFNGVFNQMKKANEMTTRIGNESFTFQEAFDSVRNG